MKNVLMIVGSLKKRSLNRQLAESVRDMLDGKARVSFLEYADVPFLNQDTEYPAPQSVERVRQAVMAADGIWIFSPEYNYQIPGVLKNLLDWLSRPLVPQDRERGSAVKGKVVTVSGVAGKSGAAGVRKNLSALLEIMSMKLVAGMGTGVSVPSDVMQSGELALSEEDRQNLAAQLELFLAEL